MTRKEACKKAQIIDFQGGYTIALVTEIFNDHEAQIIEFNKVVEETHFQNEQEYKAQLKAKDEEIERLKDQLSSVHNIMYRNGYSDAIDCYDTFGNFNTRHKPNAKARKIVAMLFWEWKKRDRIYIENKYRNPSANLALYKQASLMQETFQEAYKILKDTK